MLAFSFQLVHLRASVGRQASPLLSIPVFAWRRIVRSVLCLSSQGKSTTESWELFLNKVFFWFIVPKKMIDKLLSSDELRRKKDEGAS